MEYSTIEHKVDKKVLYKIDLYPFFKVPYFLFAVQLYYGLATRYKTKKKPFLLESYYQRLRDSLAPCAQSRLPILSQIYLRYYHGYSSSI